jgi:hypothetical protein
MAAGADWVLRAVPSEATAEEEGSMAATEEGGAMATAVVEVAAEDI